MLWMAEWALYGQIATHLQRWAKRFINLAKQDPGRAGQDRQARARTNLSQPRRNTLADLCTLQLRH